MLIVAAKETHCIINTPDPQHNEVIAILKQKITLVAVTAMI